MFENRRATTSKHLELLPTIVWYLKAAQLDGEELSVGNIIFVPARGESVATFTLGNALCYFEQVRTRSRSPT